MNRTHSVVVCALVAVGCSSGSSTTGAAATSGASSASASGSSAAAAASPSASGSAATSAALSSAALGKLTVGADSLFSDEGAVVEGFDEGSAAFAFASDGPVKVAIADVDGKPVSAPDRKASLTYTIPETGKTIEVPLKSDADKHYLVASGPELSSVVTPVKYEISGGPRPWTGILQLPAGGTKALNASAQAAAAAHAAPVVGPHGGRIERIGKDDVELLIDKDSGETRAWIIVDGKAVDPGARNFTVVIDDKPLKLKADANLSFYGKVSADMGLHLGEVHKLTGELTEGPGDHPSLLGTVLFGLRPHVYVYAPRVIVDVDVDGWTKEKRAKWDTHPDDDDDQGRDHDYHDNGKHEGSEDHGDHGKHGDDHGDHDHGDHDHGDHDHADHGDHAHADHVDHDHGDHGDDHAKPAPNGAAHGSSGKKKGRD